MPSIYRAVFNTATLALVLALLASGQTPSSSSQSSAPTVDPREQCVQSKKCGTDVNCIASCFNVPGPNDAQVQDTIQCVRQCNTADTNQWAQCRDKCINDHFQSQPSQAQSNSASKPSTTTVATTSTLGVKPASTSTSTSTSTTKGSAGTATAVPSSGSRATENPLPWTALVIVLSKFLTST
ncbi:hypothetical protein K493DRAFT_307549 [Basidiobolus meristosporus CBS 931.73]|uniref:Extracellular membrane protein CFEM domain-containing protein n=1 Tax=Basidiobolus meristosporus CBS 931.73 TaxID=1314790 RepID=A0A1Y1XDK3_9FUNG|nr:hypothetical protein K493DRAFT_307549 [Basidiobolus meristosporus CBS 931.73]|eukprot:ORX83861.1 hypothetical protein K493DRAFT_307549 [Basidiobolus meristosporus CBS 931.73]